MKGIIKSWTIIVIFIRNIHKTKRTSIKDNYKMLFLSHISQM